MDYAKFEDDQDPKYNGIKTAMKILFMDDYLIQSISWFVFLCKDESQYCLTHHLIGIAKKKVSNWEPIFIY